MSKHDATKLLFLKFSRNGDFHVSDSMGRVKHPVSNIDNLKIIIPHKRRKMPQNMCSICLDILDNKPWKSNLASHKNTTGSKPKHLVSRGI